MALISIIQGTSKTVNIQCFASDKVTPLNITGGTIYFTVNANSEPSDDTSVAFQKTVTSFVDAVNGKAIVNLAPSDTASMDADDYFYDAKLIESGGTEIAIAQDKFRVKPAITRRTA